MGGTFSRYHRTLSCKFGDPLLLGSGTTARQIPFSDEGMIGQIEVLSHDPPCFFSEGTEIFTFSGSLMIPLLQAHFLSPWLIRALGSITECRPGSPSLCLTVSGSEISPYFGIETHRYHSSAAIEISVECAGPRQHNGASPVFICCTVPEIHDYHGPRLQEQNWENSCISVTVQHINMGLAPLCCRGPAHSTDISIAALECTCECLRQNTAKFHSPTLSDTDLETLIDIR